MGIAEGLLGVSESLGQIAETQSSQALQLYAARADQRERDRMYEWRKFENEQAQGRWQKGFDLQEKEFAFKQAKEAKPNWQHIKEKIPIFGYTWGEMGEPPEGASKEEAAAYPKVWKEISARTELYMYDANSPDPTKTFRKWDGSVWSGTSGMHRDSVLFIQSRADAVEFFRQKIFENRGVMLTDKQITHDIIKQVEEIIGQTVTWPGREEVSVPDVDTEPVIDKTGVDGDAVLAGGGGGDPREFEFDDLGATADRDLGELGELEILPASETPEGLAMAEKAKLLAQGGNQKIDELESKAEELRSNRDRVDAEIAEILNSYGVNKDQHNYTLANLSRITGMRQEDRDRLRQLLKDRDAAGGQIVEAGQADLQVEAIKKQIADSAIFGDTYVDAGSPFNVDTTDSGIIIDAKEEVSEPNVVKPTTDIESVSGGTVYPEQRGHNVIGFGPGGLGDIDPSRSAGVSIEDILSGARQDIASQLPPDAANEAIKLLEKGSEEYDAERQIIEKVGTVPESQGGTGTEMLTSSESLIARNPFSRSPHHGLVHKGPDIAPGGTVIDDARLAEADLASEPAMIREEFGFPPVEESTTAETLTGENWGQMVREIAGKHGINPKHLMAIMNFETGGSFDTSVRNPQSGATGLIQFSAPVAKELGTSLEELAQMSKEEQLVYVDRYLDMRKKSHGLPERGASLDDLYMAVLYPAAIGEDSSYVLFRSGTTAYDQNKGLDSNNDGTVTKGEAVAKVRNALGGAPEAPVSTVAQMDEYEIWGASKGLDKATIDQIRKDDEEKGIVLRDGEFWGEDGKTKAKAEAQAASEDTPIVHMGETPDERVSYYTDIARSMQEGNLPPDVIAKELQRLLVNASQKGDTDAVEAIAKVLNNLGKGLITGGITNNGIMGN